LVHSSYLAPILPAHGGAQPAACSRKSANSSSPLFEGAAQAFYTKAATRPVKTGMVLAYQTSGEFFRWNPHWHAIVLEGGFDEAGRFVHIPFGNLNRMSEYFRRLIIKFFFKKKLINARLEIEHPRERRGHCDLLHL